MTYIPEVIGKHFIIDLWFCECDIENIELIKNKLIELVEKLNFNIVEAFFHKFSPYGLSGVIIISESHVAIHTYPEYEYVSIDIYTCNPNIDLKYIINDVVNIFKPKKIKIDVIDRGKF